ncbi:hypothetical protein PVL30_003209 [Lodderomyces elongisporus]|uniref:uncharacterized protein n=1 Tax=Lodderomyces elongisporus TaxID=36914 RepID=UPI002925B00C|nr:uncharacterized protein PVL30_003209 [Lodderomyces elongisporus]WLF79454.1 hypothetical protein PVL30_003209 [Lodderomyces elongisporus]
MQLSLLIFLLNFLSIASALPTLYKRSFDAESAYQSALNATWSLFWNSQYDAFNLNDPACTSEFSYAAVWDLAVVGKAIVDSGDVAKTEDIINSLYKFQNSAGWFTSSPGGSEIYTDDNAQVVWVFLAAYELTKNQQLLNTAVNLIHLIQTQWSAIGGVTWQKDETYVASISTVEAALAAVKVYEQNGDESLLTFANSSLTWLDEHLTDPTDGFYYDGINRQTWQLNKGKLTYTVGVAISTYSYLYKFTGDEAYLEKAIAKASATLQSTTFLSPNGAWNNQLCYVHLLFAGFADLITITGITQYTEAVTNQANFIYLYDQLTQGSYGWYGSDLSLYNNYVKSTGDTKSISYSYSADNYCSTNPTQPKRSALDDGSAAQIFYNVARIN